MTVNQFFVSVEKDTVFIQKIEEYCCRNALIAVNETMIFGYKIEKICRFFLQSRIKFRTVETLINVPYAAFERIVFFLSEKRG